MKHSMLWTIPLIAVLALLPLPAVTAAGQDDQHASHHGDWRDDDDKGWHDRDNDKAPLSVTVSFGAGLNTALMGPNVANDHIVPPKIEVKAGGVVNFVVAGFHQIFAYNPGVKPQDVLDNAPAFDPMNDPQSFYINYGLRPQDDPTILLYVGANPGVGLPQPPFPPPNALTPPPPFPILSNTFNRVESIVFQEPGRYLVICNVNPHFRAGMWAWVKVSK
jgi:hypothetical protein